MKIPIQAIGTLCDDCGEPRIVKSLHHEDHGYRVCRTCYNETPEPDTGRPDWEDL